jgi:hypothetical protein
MLGAPFDRLVFKGTHNSYACSGECLFGCQNDPPWMNHPLGSQIDEFGIWAIELDFGFVEVDGTPRAKVGHDGPGQTTCWGGESNDLRVFLEMVRAARALRFRPLVIFFDKKGEGQDQNDWPPQPALEEAYGLLQAELLDVFAAANIFGPDALDAYTAQNAGRLPSMPELAGKILPVGWRDRDRGGTGLIFGPARPFPAKSRPCDDCTSLDEVRRYIATEGTVFFRLDQYQANWTYDYGVPPNPLVVDHSAEPPWRVMDSEGEQWDPCPNGDVPIGEVVSEQGTYRFPYRTLGSAVRRAQGMTGSGALDLRQSGFGWTILLRPGAYNERLRIDIPLRLERDDRYPGAVVIGR